MIGEYSTAISLIVLFIAGLSLIYYSIFLTESAETQIENLENFPKGSLVQISGEITKIKKSSSGNIYWTVQDATGSITIPLFSSTANSYRNISKSTLVKISGLVTDYQGNLEIDPKEIEINVS